MLRGRHCRLTFIHMRRHPAVKNLGGRRGYHRPNTAWQRVGEAARQAADFAATIKLFPHQHDTASPSLSLSPYTREPPPLLTLLQHSITSVNSSKLVVGEEFRSVVEEAVAQGFLQGVCIRYVGRYMTLQPSASPSTPPPLHPHPLLGMPSLLPAAPLLHNTS